MAKILLVEDDTMIRDILTRRLTLEGHRIVTAADGVAGVQQARLERPDVIVMDMGLPILDGWQATHRIRSMPATKNIPIIALTAFVMADDRAKCLAIGCNEYETKPVDFGRLIGKINLLLQKTVNSQLAERLQ